MARAKRPKTKRIVALGDLHCGHAAGLTPPGWHGCQIGGPRFVALRAEMWRRYSELVDAIGPVHAVICNGDAIDGTGGRSGGTEQLTPDRDVQADMAVQCLTQWKPAAGYWLTYGTPYHTGDAEDWERVVCERLHDRAHAHAEIHAEAWLDVNGCIIGAKHKVGSSSIPHGRHTAVSREHLWNIMWAERKAQPRGDILLRSHVHYYGGAFGAGWVAMTLPALQSAATKYGGRQCSGTVDWGLVVIDVTDTGDWTWRAHTTELAAVAAVPSKL